MNKELVDLGIPNQWEAKPEEELKIPEGYIKELKFEIIVFTRKERGGQDFSFRCKKYYPADGEKAWSFENVVVDTSKRDPTGEVTLKRISYHPIISLVNIGFMVIPAPEQ